METAEMGQDEGLIGSFDGEIICEPPNNHLNKFDGSQDLNDWVARTTDPTQALHWCDCRSAGVERSAVLAG